MSADSEIGRELKANELKNLTVVVGHSETRPDIYTPMWVVWVSDNSVEFGLANIRLLLYRQPDGTLKDGRGRVIRIYEYLGEI